MAQKCSVPDCVAPTACFDGIPDYRNCPKWLANNSQKAATETNTFSENAISFSDWTGEPLKPEGLSTVTARNSPIIIGIVGKAGAGKTTFLAMLYTLLMNGKKLQRFDFAGTKTILGWDMLYHTLKFLKEKVAFPDPTPVGSNRLYHLALRDRENKLKDVVFSDASGEAFSVWSQNRNDENASQARWIADNSSAFAFFVDCVDLSERKNSAKQEIIDIAQQLKYALDGRPVIAVWSKSDRKKEIHPKIRASLEEELQDLFPNQKQIDVSNFSTSEPDELVHKNNLEVIDWAMERILLSCGALQGWERQFTKDFFLDYKLI